MRLQKILTIALLTAPVGIPLASPSLSYGQEKEAASKANSEEPKSKEVEDAKPDVVSVPDQIRGLVKDRKPAKAASVLETALKMDADNEELKALHQSIAGAFTRIRAYDKAMEQSAV